MKLYFSSIALFSIIPFLLTAQESTIIDSTLLNNQGLLLIDQKDKANTNKEQIILLQKAIILFEQSRNWETVIAIKAELAMLNYYELNYDGFENQIKELKDLLHNKTIPDSTRNESKKVLAWHSELQEDYLSAEQLHKEVFNYDLQYSNKLLAAGSANNIAFFYTNYLNDPKRAVSYYQKANDLLKDGDKENDYYRVSLLSNIAHCFMQLKQVDISKSYFHRSLKLIQPGDTDDMYIQTKWWNYQNLSDIYFNNNSLDSCSYYSNKALDILEKHNNFYPDDYQTYQTIGRFYIQKGDYPLGLQHFKKGLTRAKKQEDVFRPINAMVGLAQVLSDHGDHLEAIATLQAGIELLCPDYDNQSFFAFPSPKSFVHKKSALNLIETKANIFQKQYKKEGDLKLLIASNDHYKLATQLILLIRQGYLDVNSKYFLSETVLPIYESAIDIAFQLYQKTKDEKYLEDAFYIAEQNKSALLLESIKENTAKGFGNLPDSLLQLEKDMRLELSNLDKKIYTEKKKTTRDESLIKNLANNRFTKKEDYNNLIKSIEQNYPKYFEFKHKPTIATIHQLQKEYLNDNTTLLEYFVGNKSIFLFSIQKNKASLYQIEKSTGLLNSFNQLKNIVTNPPNSVEYQSDLKKYNLLASSFHDLLLQEALASNKNEHLIIIPDDFLSYLPFEILLTHNNKATSYNIADQDYLLKQFNINYSFSASLLLNTIDINYTNTKSFVGFAPDFKNPLIQSSRKCNEEELYSLQCSENEITKINQLLEGTTFTQKQASMSTFNSIIKDYNIIHLATHACIDEEDPNFNRIYFADDYLSNYDLTNMRIEANLAVLSACNTNVGPLMKGDGVSSISKGFILAGCPSVLTSLWSVDDCSTSEIMIDFYKHLQQGASKSQALQQAKTNYLQQADPAQVHPYYWAPFLLSGQNQTIITAGKSNIWIWGLLALIGLVSLVRLFGSGKG